MFEQPRPEQYIATALETQEQAKKTALNYCTHKFHPRWPVSHSSLAMFRSHVDMFSLCQGIFYVLRFWIVFVVRRISFNRGSVPYVLL